MRSARLTAARSPTSALKAQRTHGDPFDTPHKRGALLQQIIRGLEVHMEKETLTSPPSLPHGATPDISPPIAGMGAAQDRWRTPVCSLLGCDVPILLAGMGGVARSELVAAVTLAGGYGILGMVRETPQFIAQEINAVRARTDRPFAVNLIPAATDAALLDAELGVCFDSGVPAMCFFWDVVPSVVARAKAAGCLVLHQVGSLAAAFAAEAAGADVLIVQGVEAGGHVHGTVAALVLVEQVARATQLPVIASGGFATGASLIAALSLGAQGIHCGTAFLATAESFAHDDHKSRVLAATAEDTVYTDVFALNWPPNAPVRVIRNSLTDALGHNLRGHHPDALPREVIAEDAGAPLLKYSTDSPLRTTTGNLEAMAAFAGQSAALIDTLPTAADRIATLLSEADAALARLGKMTAN